MKIKKGDTIKILSGKDRGKTAKVIRVDTKEGKVLAEGVNLKKKHVRAKREDKKGEVILLPAPFPAGKAMVVCPNCKETTRVKMAVRDAGKTRICRSCESAL